MVEAAVEQSGTGGDGNVLFENGAPAGGWSVFAGGQRVVTTASQQGLRISRGSDGLLAEWATRVPVSLTMSGAPVNFSREADRGLGLSLTLRVDKAPVSNVVLAMGCGPLCGGKLDFTGTLRNLAQRGGFATINVPLACLRSAGADLSDVPTGFALTATNAFAVSIQSVKVSRDGEALSCAQVPPVEAAAAMTGPGHSAVAEHGSKKIAVSERISKKKKAGISHASGKKSAVHPDRKPARKRHR